MSLGTRLKELREKKRESLQQTADAFGTSKAHIWQIEQGQADNQATGVLKKLVSHFDVSVAYLVGEQLEARDAEPELVGLFRQAGIKSDRRCIKSVYAKAPRPGGGGQLVCH